MIAALVTAALGACGGDPASGDEPAPTNEPATALDVRAADALLEADPRIVAILNECVRDDYYEADTSDPVALLLPKLHSGRGLAKDRAVEALARLGEASVGPLAAQLAAWRDDPQRAGSIQNTIGALALNDAEASVEALLSVTDHPQAPVRVAALRGLRNKTIEAKHFDELEALVYVTAGIERTLALQLLFQADRERAALAFVEWLAEDVFPASEESMAEALSQVDSEAVREAALVVRSSFLPRTRIWFDAGRAAFGDAEGAIEFQRALADERFQFRSAAVRAAIGTRAWKALVEIARSEEDPGLRGRAVGVLGGAFDDESEEIQALAYEALRRALDDVDPSVRHQARVQLLLRGESEAVERTLALLDGNASVLSEVLPSLRTAMTESASLARRVEERLLDRIDRERDLPPEKRVAGLQSLGLVPRESAARLLLETGRALDGQGIQMQGRRAHEWATVHASNTGEVGRRLLYVTYRDESDPLRRLDLLWAVGTERDELTREVMLEVVDDDTAPQFERVYAASVLANIGPVEEIAPILERVALRLEGEPRRAIQCQLHYWF